MTASAVSTAKAAPEWQPTGAISRSSLGGSADGAWLSLVIHHIPDLGAAAQEIRRVLRPGAAAMIRQAFPGRTSGR
jgi:SAM-dependent methyltransferase